MQSYHYLGALRKIGNTIWYVAINNDEWVALISFSAAALKCRVRDVNVLRMATATQKSYIKK